MSSIQIVSSPLVFLSALRDLTDNKCALLCIKDHLSKEGKEDVILDQAVITLCL